MDINFSTFNEFCFNPNEHRSTLAFTENQIHFVNENALWFIGTPKDEYSKYPHQIQEIENVIEVSSGIPHFCCLTSDGDIYGFSDSLNPTKMKITKKDAKVKAFACGPDYTITFMDDYIIRSYGTKFIDSSTVGNLRTEICYLPDTEVLKIFCGVDSFWVLCENGKLGYCASNNKNNHGFLFKILCETSNVKKIITTQKDDFLLLDDDSLYQISNPLNNYCITKVRDNVFDFACDGDIHYIVNSLDNSLSITDTAREKEFLSKQIAVRNIVFGFLGYFFIIDCHGKLWIWGRHIDQRGMGDKAGLSDVPEDLISIALPVSKAKSAKK